MNNAAVKNYMKAKVFTAPPEQLQLLLYDGAIRFCEQGRAALVAKNYEQSFHALSRAQKIVLELSGALKHDVAPEMCKNLAALYAFFYRRLVQANSQRKIEPLDEVIKLIRYQRETWLLLMEKLGKEKAAAAASQIDVPGPDERMEQSISMSA
jgi:flagellar secretion chaperone FliS